MSAKNSAIWPRRFWDCAYAAQAIAHRVHTVSYASTVTRLGVKEGDENRHEGAERYCWQFGIIAFGIAHAQRAQLRTECAQRAMLALLLG